MTTPLTSRDAGRTQNPMPSISGTVPPPVHTNDSDPCAIRTAGLNISTRMAAVWDRSKAKISRLLGKAPAEVWTTDESTCRLPYEIVEMITAHITHDLRDLKACSLTCRSWYSAAAPLLHHTLTLTRGISRDNLIQLEPLSELHELGLLHFVKILGVKGGLRKSWLTSHASSRLHLHCFSTLSNVHTLKLECVDIYSFIPGVEEYFKHFSPTLRSIALFGPRCTPRQLSHFLSLFPNLDNIEIQGTHIYIPDTIPDTELVPFSTPRLQGRLVLHSFSWIETWEHLISLCGGLRFHYIRLPWNGRYTSILLEACAETLETVRFDTMDGESCRGSSTNLS